MTVGSIAPIGWHDGSDISNRHSYDNDRQHQFIRLHVHAKHTVDGIFF